MIKKLTLMLAAALSVSVNANAELRLSALPDKEKPFRLAAPAEEGEGMKGRIVVTAGAGLNMLGTSMELRYLANSYYDFEGNMAGRSAWPMLHLGVDYGFHEKFSVGVAFGYQKLTMHLKDVVTYGDLHHDTWTRIHVAARADYYIVAKENVNLYTGIKVGYNLYSVSSTVPQNVYPGYTTFLWQPAPASAQAHFGFSYFVSGKVGFNAEIGLGYGVPYLFLAGVTMKI